MPVSVTLGGDPVYTYAATAPLPDHFDEYMLAGFLRRKKVKLVKCLTNDLEVPEDVDFVIEGYVDPAEELILEGPFGDHTGFYSLADYYPRFHITCITHRKNAVYPATIVGIPPQEDAWIGKATERIFLEPIRLTMHPDILDLHMPVAGVFHNLVIFKIDPAYDGQALKIINGLWGAGQMMFTKVMIAVNSNVDITDYKALAKHVSEYLSMEDIIFSKGPNDVLDHAASHFAFGGKIGLNACAKPKAPSTYQMFDKIFLIHKFPEIRAINDSLLEEGISLVIIAVEKTQRNQISVLGKAILLDKSINGVKFLVFVDHMVDVNSMADVAWLGLNNIDPQRDIMIIDEAMLIDGTSKSRKLDNFDRDWPNVIVMDDETIGKVNEKWNLLGLGDCIKSPSLTYKKLVRKGGAYVDE